MRRVMKLSQTSLMTISVMIMILSLASARKNTRSAGAAILPFDGYCSAFPDDELQNSGSPSEERKTGFEAFFRIFS